MQLWPILVLKNSRMFPQNYLLPVSNEWEHQLNRKSLVKILQSYISAKHSPKT